MFLEYFAKVIKNSFRIIEIFALCFPQMASIGHTHQKYESGVLEEKKKFSFMAL